MCVSTLCVWQCVCIMYVDVSVSVSLVTAGN